jgi:hypothetical protein
MVRADPTLIFELRVKAESEPRDSPSLVRKIIELADDLQKIGELDVASKLIELVYARADASFGKLTLQ